MKRNGLKALLAAAVLIVLLCAGGCSGPALIDESEVAVVRPEELHIYYIEENEDQLKAFSIRPEGSGAEAVINELLNICTQPSADDGTLIPLLTDETEVKDYQLEGDVLKLNFSGSYANLLPVRELLTRAGLVKTFTQLDAINYVEFLVEGEPLKDRNGVVIGKQGRDSFVEDASRSINSYKSASMILYYTDKSGEHLIPEERNVYYNSSEPLERAVVEEILNGPAVEGHYPTAASETKVLGVSIQEGICYVNLDETFSNTALTVQEKVQIYSIVNSLVDTCHVAKVHFSINGVHDRTFRDTLSLDELFEKNEELITE